MASASLDAPRPRITRLMHGRPMTTAGKADFGKSRRLAPMVPSTPMSDLGYDPCIHRTAATAPVERSRQRTLPIRRPDHQDRSRPIRDMQSVEPKDRSAGPNRLWRARKHKQEPQDDDPFRDCDVRRSRKFHASAPPARHIPRRGERIAALLPHQRVRQLPRGRPEPRRRDLPGLRLYAAGALIFESSSAPARSP